MTIDSDIPAPEKRKRGRPPGSKNKPKDPILYTLNTEELEKRTVQGILAKRLLPYIGQAVSYYDEGWRFGVLTHVTDTIAKLKHPMGRVDKVPVENVKPYEKNA